MIAPLPPGSLRVATYNVHGCVGMDGRRSEERIAEVIGELRPDIIGLQELDMGRRRSGGVDQANLIAGHLGYQRHFHPAIIRQEEHYGDAILSRWPLTVRRGAGLPTERAFLIPETRGALWVEISTPLGSWQIINTHLGLGRRERKDQMESLTGPDWAEAIPADSPLLILGDFNSLPGSPAWRTMTRKMADASMACGQTRHAATFPTLFPIVTLDYIFVNRAVQVLSLVVHPTKLARMASDHYPLLAEAISIPPLTIPV